MHLCKKIKQDVPYRAFYNPPALADSWHFPFQQNLTQNKVFKQP